MACRKLSGWRCWARENIDSYTLIYLYELSGMVWSPSLVYLQAVAVHHVEGSDGEIKFHLVR